MSGLVVVVVLVGISQDFRLLIVNVGGVSLCSFPFPCWITDGSLSGSSSNFCLLRPLCTPRGQELSGSGKGVGTGSGCYDLCVLEQCTSWALGFSC